MQYYHKIIGLFLIFVAVSPYQVKAESSWWDKGLTIYDALDEETDTTDVTVAETSNAFKQALQIGSEDVVAQLGTLDGFNDDAAIHIPLPKELHTVKTVLNELGLSAIVDDLELKLNRAAETATPKAKELFVQAISEMTFDDVNRIYNGADDAAGRYFQKKMSAALSAAMQPFVENSLAEVGAIQAYDTVMGSYQTLPFVPDAKANLTEYVLDKGMDGIFYYIAEEEAAIRKDPAKQTTALLKRVFGME